MTPKPKTPRQLERESHEFLIARGWIKVKPGHYEHPRISCAWPLYDAERIERESVVPLADRVDPFKVTT